jgi:hypothetical protein
MTLGLPVTRAAESAEADSPIGCRNHVVVLANLDTP